MSKAKQNKFLIGYFSALTVGTIGLGYLAWSSASASSEAMDTYDTTKTKLQSLHKAPIYPKSENVDAKRKQVNEFVSKVDSLRDGIAAYQVPLVADMNNSAFQSKLQKVRDGVVAEAKDAGTKLPDNFEMGMGTYLASFPEPTAVPKLNAWLDGIHFVVSTLISSGVKEINTLTRPELAFEKKAEPKAEEAPKNAKAKTPPAKPAAKGKNAEPAAPVVLIKESEVVERYPFTITFTAASRPLNDVLTALANTTPGKNAPYFYNIRVLRIENEQKIGAETSSEVSVREENDPVDQKPFKRDASYIFGEEKVQVYLGLDLIRFPESAPAAVEAK